MYRIPVYKIMLVKEKNQSSEVKQIKSPEDVISLAESYMAGLDRENFVILMLDNKNKLIGINTVSVGSLNTTTVHPREAFKPALLANSAAIILVHNHPSGDPTPSREDIETTKRLHEAGEILGIKVLDHIVIGDYSLSLKAKGLF